MLKEFNSILIKPNVTVKTAMKQLDITAEKILFLVDEEMKLVGSLTDGDIRRFILNDGDIEESVNKAANLSPFNVRKNYNLVKIKSEIIKRRITFVPVVNDNNVIIEFIISDRIIESKLIKEVKERINIPIVIMAGGKGTRLDPFTKILPKPLIPIGDKTVLEIIIDKFKEYGLNHFYLSINHKANIIKSYFEDIETPYTITFIEENLPLGTGGSLRLLKGELSGPFLVTNCDIIIDADYNDILKHHQKSNNDITIVASMKHYKIPYGVCEIKNGGLLDTIKEKPEYDFLVNTGMYVLESKLLNIIPENKLFDITELIETVNNSGGTVAVYPISENSWIDTGDWVEYKKAINKLTL